MACSNWFERELLMFSTAVLFGLIGFGGFMAAASLGYGYGLDQIVPCAVAGVWLGIVMYFAKKTGDAAVDLVKG